MFVNGKRDAQTFVMFYNEASFRAVREARGLEYPQ